MNAGERKTALRRYYRDHYPFELIYQWFNGTDSKLGLRREFAMVLQVLAKGDGSVTTEHYDEVYRRHLSFANWKAWREQAIASVPIRMEIGALYARPPSLPEPRYALHRELVFDIDLNDYAQIRTRTQCCECGAERKACRQCWVFIRSAMRIVDFILFQLYGFERRQWVFSGRRGVHCWVFDERARRMGSFARATLIEIIGSSENLRRYAPDVHWKLFNCESYYNHFRDTYTQNESWLDSEDKRAFLIEEVFRPKYPKCIVALQKYFREKAERDTEDAGATTTSQSEIDTVRNAYEGVSLVEKPKTWWNCIQRAIDERPDDYEGLTIEDIFVFYCWPRLDEKVTTQINHLLKLPYCVHPATDLVCVPLSVDTIDQFDPENRDMLHINHFLLNPSPFQP